MIRSWLLDLLVRALDEDPELDELRGYAEDSGEGRWTVEAAIDNAVPLPVITASLFARFASRQDDSPAMKAVAALRNQFGGHAVAAGRPDASGAGVHRRSADAACTSHLSLTDFRSCERAELALEPGVDGARRAERAGQDQPGRGARLPRRPWARTGSPPTRRWCGAAPSARSCGPRWCATAGELLVELEINPGKANRARLNRAPVPRPREVLGVLRTVLFAPEDLALVQGDPSRAPALPRRPAGARAPRLRRRARRLRPGAQAAQRAAEDRRRRAAAGGAATCAPSTSGTSTWPSTARSCSAARLDLVDDAARRCVDEAYDAVAAGERAARARATVSSPRRRDCRPVPRPASRRRAAAARCSPSWPAVRPQRARARGHAWSARTATTWC